MEMNLPEQQQNATNADAELDFQLTRALEAVPEVWIADDFARRVLSQVPARRWEEVRPSGMASVGRRVALGTLVALFCLMLALLPAARGSTALAATSVEWLFCLEFVAIILWMSVGQQNQR